MGVDISQGLAAAFNFIVSVFNGIIDVLDNIFIFPHVSVLSFFIALVVLGMILTSIFVLYDGGIDD